MKKNLLIVVTGLLVSLFVAAFLFVRGYSSIKKGNLAKLNQTQQNLYSDNSATDTSAGTDEGGDDSGDDNSSDTGDSGDDSGD